MKRILILALSLPLTLACRKEEPVPAFPATPPPAAASTAAPAPGTSSGLAYELPQGWNRVPPASSMRVDQAIVPGTAGSAELAVFFFGPGGGGPVQDNIDRWAAQVESTDPPAQTTMHTNDVTVTWIEISGTLKPSTMGMGPTTPQPSSRLYAAVVEGEGGPWFIKMTGPEATMAEQRDAFLALLDSLRTASGQSL